MVVSWRKERINYCSTIEEGYLSSATKLSRCKSMSPSIINHNTKAKRNSSHDYLTTIDKQKVGIINDSIPSQGKDTG